MDIIDIHPSHPLWPDVWRLYEVSFPDYERRGPESHRRADADPRFRGVAGLEGGGLAGLLFYWVDGGMAFVEHLATEPRLRGSGIGSALMRWLFAAYPGTHVILEIDPPEDDISRRRLRFYERLGFHVNDYPYFHTSYSLGGPRHPLVLMSRPDPIDREEFDAFLRFVRGVVLQYVD